MSKKILFMSSAKLTAICFGLLLAVFCTIGMSFRPVYSEDEKELVMSGPRRAHWVAESSGCSGTSYTYKNKTDYGKAVATVSGTGGTVSIAGSITNGTQSITGNNSTTATLTWNTALNSDGEKDLSVHTNSVTLTASYTTGYAFVGWYDEDDNFLSGSEEFSTPVTIPGGVYEKGTITTENQATTKHGNWQSSSNPYTETFYAKFVVDEPVDITFLACGEGGSYTVTIDGSTSTVTAANVVKTGITKSVTLTATPAEGYVFTGWYQINSSDVLSDLSTSSTFSKKFAENVSIGARFVSTSTPKFKNISTSTEYYGLKAALSAAVSGQTIIPVAEETVLDGADLLPADNGTYTIPDGVTLLVPYNTSNTVQTKPVKINTTANATAITIYKKLKFTEGVNIVCNGTICVGGQALAGNGGNPSGYVTGACGFIDMSAGGHIELNYGSTLYCWGFIKGQDMDQGNNTQDVGTITANDGATIWEDFSVGDWRGGTFTGTIAMGSSRFFPFQSYFIQNIEIPVTYKFGSTLKNFFTFNMSSSAKETAFDVIGSSAALFKLTDANSLVRKWYDPTTDLMCYELSGTAVIDHIELNVSGYDVNSEDFDLPINSNMQIILTKCTLTLNKPMLIQPGAVVEIKEDANVTIATKIYLYDKDEWGPWISSKYYRSYGGDYPILTSHKNRGNGSSNKDMDDAIFMVDGTLTVSSGGLYSSTGGANVMGNDGGKVIFSASLPSAGSVKWYKSTNSSGDGETGTTTMTAANLCNEDGFYTKSTKNTFHNVHGRWFVDGKQNEKTDHTYDFTYMAGENIGEENENRNTGADVNTDAVYSNDKTGLEARMKWFNVTSDCSGEDEDHVMHYWWKDANDYFYNWTMLSAWHQFIPTETEGLYSGSNNKLYTKTDVSTACTWSELGETDVNCLYTIEDTKKALVDGHFIALEPNSDDAAFHEAADPTKYYICFEGCNWHEATKYEGEKKAYVVDETTFIWYEERWMAVEREEPFFYTKDETNVTIYYEYIGSEWVVAQPYIEVTDATETRKLLRFNEAITVASGKKNATITLLRDLVNITTPMTFTAQNTTCTLDLNGHVAELQVTGSGTTAIYMLTLNCAGTTFTITDNTADKKGELKLITSFTTENNTKRWGGIYLQNGALVMANGKLHVENPVPYTKSTKVGYIEAILVASGKTLTVNGGTIEAKSAYNPYGIEAASGTPTININGGTIETIATTNDSPYGIIGYGTINIKGGEVRAIASGSSSSRGVSVSAGSSYQGTVNVTGGTIYSEATSSAQGIYCGGTAVVTGDYNATTPNNTPKNRYYAKANISGGTITAICRTSTSSFGVLSYGTTTISGGTITSTVQKSNQNTAYGVCTRGGTTTISAGANITANAPTIAYGVTATAANGDSNRGWPHVGVVNITGGTITANTTNTTTAYGLLVTGATWTINKTDGYSVFNGDYAAAGTATVTGGTFKANAKTTLSRGIAVAATKTLNDASATPTCTINGGYYQMTGTGDVLGCNASALAADFHINGGYYSHDGNLAAYAASPKHVLTLASGDANRPPYYYKVAEAYQVTFKTEDGTANIIDPIYQEVNTKPVCSTEPTKASTSTNSFTFDGWATAANGNKAYEPNGLPNVTSAGATYYAHFATTTLKYRVHLDATTNGGECATENIYVNPGAAVGTLPTATKYGYTFSGWFTAASGGTKLEATTDINADADYYAQFTANSHTLTWDLDGGKVSTAGKIGSTTWPAKNATGTPSTSVAFGTILTTIPVVTKTGYTFNRWDPVPTSSMPDEDVTYTALWNPATNTKYYVKHYQQNIDDDNYTLVETDELTGTTDATVTPDRKSYDGFLTPTPQQLTIGAAGTSELVYNYDRVVYTINWNASANGGACATTSTDVRHGANIALPAATKAGHILDGWYTKAEGGNKISDGAAVLQNYGTLYAQFIEVPTYKLTWDWNGGETSSTSYTAAGNLLAGDPIVYPEDNTMTRENYVFNGWSTNASTMPNENFTITAQWTPAVASVTANEITTYHATVADAISAANDKNNAVVTMLQNASVASEVTISAAMTIDLNGKTITSTLASATGVFKINASGKTVTIQDNATGGKINHTASTSGSNYLYGVNITAGSMSIESGTIYAENTGSSRAYGINTATSATLVTVSGSASIEAKSSSSFGIYTNNACNLTMTGGTFAATGSGSRGVYTKGTTTLTNAIITASGSDSRAIFAKEGTMTINSGTYTAEGTGSVYVIFFESGTVTVNGGKFKGSTCEIAKRNSAYNVILQGGVYVHETDLAAKSTTPYHVLPITSGADYDAGYRYKVAEAYTVTFNNYDGTQLQTGYVEKNVLPTYDGTPTKPSDAQYDYIFTGWDPAIVLVTANATYTATFNDHTIRSYQVRWENIDGSEIKTDQKDYGTQPSYEGTPTYSDGTGKLYVFRAWKRQSTGDEYASGDVFPYVGGAETYIAQYNVINNLDVADEQTISVDATVDVTTVHVAGKLNVSSGTLTTKDLILEGTPNSSGEILGAETVTATHAYFDFSNGAEGFKARTWYAVAVPWQVYVPVSELGGVYLKKGEGDYVQQRLGKTYDLIYYDGARRATGANKAWNYVEDDAAAKQIMYPGRAYMIYLIADADIIRFERKDGADLLITEIEAHTYGDDNTPTTLANWNGIANPATYHAYLNVGATEGRGQVYNADTKQYNLFKMNENKLVVGQPIFVQSAVDGTVVANSTTYSPSLAPRRAKEHSALTRYELYLAPSLDVATDQIIVRMSEEKEEDEYTVGQDLTKMGVSDIVPQMWVDRYDSKMCINTAIPTDDQAYYPLGISVPQNGEYDIFLDDEPDSESTLYLTYDGEVIWNLSYGFYVAHLEKGTNTHYGLRIVKTPKVATGIDNAETSGKDINVYKIIVDDKVFIIRGNQVYGIDGRLAK